MADDIIRQHTKEFDLPKLDDAQLADQLRVFGELYDKRKMVPGDAAAIQNHLAKLNDEQQSRGQEKKTVESQSLLDQLWGQAGVEDTGSADRSRQYLNDVFNIGKTSGTQSINEAYAPQEQQAIDEAGAAGLLRNPGYLTSVIGNLRAKKQANLRDLFSGLEGQRAQSGLGLEDTIFNRGVTNKGLALQKFGASQGANQFGQTLGLQQQQFGETKRQNQMSDMYNQMQLDQAQKAGDQMAEARKPGTLDYLNTAFAGLGQLGSVAGGVASLGSAFSKAPKPVPCWVAEELYGVDSEKTHTLRKFMQKHMREDSYIGKFARLYSVKGKEWAKMIKSNLPQRKSFRKLYDGFYNLSLTEN